MVAKNVMSITHFRAELLLTAEVTKQPDTEINGEGINLPLSRKVKSILVRISLVQFITKHWKKRKKHKGN